MPRYKPYLEEGYALAAELGLEVLPVYVRDGELIDARPFLVGSNLRRFRRQPGLGSLLPLLGSCLYFVLHVLRLVAVSCVVPFFRLASLLLTFEFFDLWKNLLHSSFRKGYFSLKRRINDGLGRRVAFQPGDVLFMPAYWHDTQPGLYLQLKRKGLVLCPLVHDILPITHPEFYESPWKERFARWVPELLSLSDHIYYVSEATREAVAAVNASRYHRELPAGTVLHHGSDFSRSPSAPARAASPAVSTVLEGAPYLLMVGSRAWCSPTTSPSSGSWPARTRHSSTSTGRETWARRWSDSCGRAPDRRWPSRGPRGTSGLAPCTETCWRARPAPTPPRCTKG